MSDSINAVAAVTVINDCNRASVIRNVLFESFTRADLIR